MSNREALKHPVTTKLNSSDLEQLKALSKRKRKRPSAVVRMLIRKGLKQESQSKSGVNPLKGSPSAA